MAKNHKTYVNLHSALGVFGGNATLSGDLQAKLEQSAYYEQRKLLPGRRIQSGYANHRLIVLTCKNFD